MVRLAVTIAAATAILGAGAFASTSANAKSKHKHMASAEAQVLVPGEPLIGGPPVRQGKQCLVTTRADWGNGYWSDCPKKK